MFQFSNYFYGLSLDLLLLGLCLSCAGDPRVLQGGSHQSRIERENHLPVPAGQGSFYTTQATIDFLGCKCRLPACIQFYIHQYFQVAFCRAALNLFIPQSVLLWSFSLTHMQGIALVKCYSVHMGSFLKLVEVALDKIHPFKEISFTT